MRLLLVLLCSSIAGAMLLTDLLNQADMTTLVNDLVQIYGVDVTENQCRLECATIFKQYTLDLGCNFACKFIKDEIHRRWHYPTLKPTAAPTPAPFVPLKPTPPQ